MRPSGINGPGRHRLGMQMIIDESRQHRQTVKVDARCAPVSTRELIATDCDDASTLHHDSRLDRKLIIDCHDLPVEEYQVRGLWSCKTGCARNARHGCQNKAAA